MIEPTEEEKIENTRRLFANSKGIYQKGNRWYHSVTDPEAKVIINFDTGELIIRDKKIWEAYVSNTWINPKK